MLLLIQTDNKCNNKNKESTMPIILTQELMMNESKKSTNKRIQEIQETIHNPKCKKFNKATFNPPYFQWAL